MYQRFTSHTLWTFSLSSSFVHTFTHTPIHTRVHWYAHSCFFVPLWKWLKSFNGEEGANNVIIIHHMWCYSSPWYFHTAGACVSIHKRFDFTSPTPMLEIHTPPASHPPDTRLCTYYIAALTLLSDVTVCVCAYMYMCLCKLPLLALYPIYVIAEHLTHARNCLPN